MWPLSKVHFLKLKATETIRLYIVSDYHDCIDPQREIITVEPKENHIHCETTRKFVVTETY